MTSLAFMCTGRNTGWDPLCNSSHLLLLFVIGITMGAGAATVLARGASTRAKLAIWILSILACVVVSLVLGFAAE